MKTKCKDLTPSTPMMQSPTDQDHSKLSAAPSGLSAENAQFVPIAAKYEGNATKLPPEQANTSLLSSNVPPQSTAQLNQRSSQVITNSASPDQLGTAPQVQAQQTAAKEGKDTTQLAMTTGSPLQTDSTLQKAGPMEPLQYTLSGLSQMGTNPQVIRNTIQSTNPTPTSAQPQTGMAQPEYGMAQPQTGMPQPEFGRGMPQSEYDMAQHQAGMPQAGMPQAGMPQAGIPQAGIPQAGIPQAGMPQAGMPQSVYGMAQYQTGKGKEQSLQSRIAKMNKLAQRIEQKLMTTYQRLQKAIDSLGTLIGKFSQTQGTPQAQGTPRTSQDDRQLTRSETGTGIGEPAGIMQNATRAAGQERSNPDDIIIAVSQALRSLP